MRIPIGSVLAPAVAAAIALAGCAGAEQPSVRPPTDPRLRVLWDRALESEQTRADALALTLAELELHAGRLTADDDPGAGEGGAARIDEDVLAVRDPSEGTALAIFGARSHFRIAVDGTPVARASAIVPHGEPSVPVAECVDCIVLGSGRIAIDGAFRGAQAGGTPLTIAVRGVLERTAISQLGDHTLETLFAPALAQRGLRGFFVRGSTLGLESAREALDVPELRDGEQCRRVLAYRVRIEIDLRVLARRAARIVSPPRAFERCCELDGTGAPGPACRERDIDR